MKLEHRYSQAVWGHEQMIEKPKGVIGFARPAIDLGERRRGLRSIKRVLGFRQQRTIAFTVESGLASMILSLDFVGAEKSHKREVWKDSHLGVKGDLYGRPVSSVKSNRN